jgi:hypothetical protein
MRSIRFLAVAVLAVVLVASVFFPVAAQGGGGTIVITKITTNNDLTTSFPFAPIFLSPSSHLDLEISGGQSISITTDAGDYPVIETVPTGWVLREIGCSSGQPNSFDILPGEGAIIHLKAGDTVRCTFTNCPLADCPAPEAVGGVVTSVSTLSILAPWLAVIGLVGCIGTAVAVAKKRHR